MKKLSFFCSIKRRVSVFLIFTMLMSCFNFTALAEEDTQSVNVIGNSGFENDLASVISDWKFNTTDNWEYKNTQIATAEFHNGNQSAVIGNNTSTKGYVGQRVTLKLATTYVLEAYIKGGGLSLNIGKGSGYPDQDKNTVAQKSIEPSENWQKVTLEYTTYDVWGTHTTDPFVVIIKNSDDYKDESGNYPAVYIDDVILTEKTEAIEPTTNPTEEPEETQNPTETPTAEPLETAAPSLPPIKDNYESGVLEIGDSVNFDFGASAASGYISVEPTRDYFGEADNHNLTYGFLGLGEDGYSKSGTKNDSFEMVKDQQITLYNGGMPETSDASQDNVYAHQSILSPNNTANYDMGDGTVPIRFAMKAQQHSYYRVKSTVGCADTTKPARVSIFNEKRHPVATNVNISAGDTYTVEFTANVMDVYYKNDKAVYKDDMLNIVVAGENVGLAALEITRLNPEDAPKTIWVCSDSTGCDQRSDMPFYPLQNYCGVGQYLSKYLTDMTVSNQGEGGLDSNDNMHFNMAKQQWKQGDYLYVEYGHNESALTDSDGNVTKTAVERYKDNLNKYYDAAHDAGVKLIVVGPIDRAQSRLYNKDTHTWTSSLSGFSNAGKAFVEEKIASGADDIAFIDLNASWINFLNDVTENVAQSRLALGMDSALTYSEAATHYYFTYNKSGATDQTHINDAGADNASSIFYQQVKQTVEAGMAEEAVDAAKKQAAVLKDIYDDINTALPYTVDDDVIKEGYAPNSLYPAKYTSRVEYPYSASIEDITKNNNGTLKAAKVRVLQDLPEYAAVYVTAYDKENNKLGTITSAEHIDNTSEKAGTVKELSFNSDIIPHHFKAKVYYCDQNNNRLTGKQYKSAVSAQYESRTVLNTFINDDFSESDATFMALQDGDSVINQNGWNSRGGELAVTKQTEADGSYINFKADTKSRYFFKSLGESIDSGKLEISMKIRYKSGSAGIHGAQDVSSSSWGSWRPSGGGNIAFSGTSVKNGSVNIGTVNTDEWIDYRILIDLDVEEQTSEVYCGAYGVVEAPVTLSAGEKITQLLINSDPSSAGEFDIKDIKVCTVETYDFTAQDEVPTFDPEDMDSEYKRSLLFSGQAVSDDEGIFGKTSEVYLLSNTSANISNWGSDTEKGVKSGSNVYATINVAMDNGSDASLRFGRSNYYMEINLNAGEENASETGAVTATGKNNSTPTVGITLKSKTWYRLDFSGDCQTNAGNITVTDIVKNTVVTTVDIPNVWSSTQVTGNNNYIYWNKDGSEGDVYIANSWLYSKSCGTITADSNNVTLTEVPTLIGEKKDVTITANEGYTLDSITYNGTEVKAADNVAVVSVTGTAGEQKITVEFAKLAEEIPNIIIDFENEKLTGFMANSVYIINEKEITPETTEISVANYIGQEITIVKKGNNTTTVDSEPQTLEISPRPSTPLGIVSVDESEENANDGKITGVTAAMEYKLSADSDWTDITGIEITGLAHAAYNVRFKATKESFASESIRVVVNAKGKYIITFNDYNGIELTHISISEGTLPSYDGTPTREQDDRYTYEFIGWDFELAIATENKTYTAQYREIPRTYTVELNVNGGTINGESIESYTYGAAVPLPTDITRADYIFNGWYDNSECTGEAVTEISETDTGNKIYYAGWTENKIREYLDALDGFKEKLTIEKITDKNGTTLVISPLNNEALPILTLYSAVYSENKLLKKVTVVSYRTDENGIIKIPLSEPHIDNGESYKLMLWSDEYAPVIEAISKIVSSKQELSERH